MKAARKLRKLQQPRSLIDFVRQFLTPSVWKQARQSVPRNRQPPRWDLQPLVLIMMAMTWAAGDSQDEKFVTARGFYVACYHARKRPGTTLEGFQKARSRVPLRQFKALAEGVRWQIRAHFATQLLVDGFEPMGCDGSRIECCRSAELDVRLGQAGNDDSAPTVWLTALVHLASGTLWSWRLGPGAAAEVVHLRHLLGTLSPQALIICDAAYMGYELVRAILDTLTVVPVPDVVEGPSLHPRESGSGELDRRHRPVLAWVRSEEGTRTDHLSLDPHPCHRPGNARRLAADRRLGPGPVVGGDRREVLPLEVAQ